MPVIKSRLPRPDDPTPRKPPSAPFGKALDLRRVASFNASSDLARKRQKVNGSIANLGSDVRLAHKLTPEGTFKIPSLPDKNAKLNGSKAKEKDKGKGKATTLDDVFGSESLVAGSSGGAKRKAENKGKRKRESEGDTIDETLQETENKNVRVSTFRQPNYADFFISVSNDLLFIIWLGVSYRKHIRSSGISITTHIMDQPLLWCVYCFTGSTSY